MDLLPENKICRRNRSKCVAGLYRTRLSDFHPSGLSISTTAKLRFNSAGIAWIFSGFFIIVLNFFGLAITLVPPAMADEFGLRGIIGPDDRQIVDSSAYPWGAIGHVNIAGFSSRGMCTGTLIAPRIVLTAAHCLTNKRTKKPHAAGDVHFLPGVKFESRLGHSKAQCLRFHRDYEYIDPARAAQQMSRSALLEKIKTDVAIIVLAEDLPVRPLAPTTARGFPNGTALIHAAYPADRRFLLSADKTCKIERKVNGLWGTTCDTQGGSSGGPVLAKQNGELRFGAIMVGTMGRSLTLAVPMPGRDKLSLNASCPKS